MGSCGYFLLSFFFLFFLTYCQRSEIGRLPYFHTWCGLSANLEWRPEICCMRLAENTGRKNRQKIAICTPLHNFIRLYLHNEGMYRQSGKKFVKQQHLLHMFSQHGELWPTNGRDQLASLRHPSKLQRISRLGFVTAPTSLNRGQWNFAGCLAVSWAGTLYIHFRGLLPPNVILPAAKFNLHPSLVFSYIGSVTAQHSSSGFQLNLTVQCGSRNGITEISHRTPPILSRAAIMLGIGQHFSSLAILTTGCVLPLYFEQNF